MSSASCYIIGQWRKVDFDEVSLLYVWLPPPTLAASNSIITETFNITIRWYRYLNTDWYRSHVTANLKRDVIRNFFEYSYASSLRLNDINEAYTRTSPLIDVDWVVATRSSVDWGLQHLSIFWRLAYNRIMTADTHAIMTTSPPPLPSTQQGRRNLVSVVASCMEAAYKCPEARHMRR